MINKASRSEIREKSIEEYVIISMEQLLLLVWQYSVPTSICMHRSLMTQLEKL